jgi:hypothetical protein
MCGSYSFRGDIVPMKKEVIPEAVSRYLFASEVAFVIMIPSFFGRNM